MQHTTPTPTPTEPTMTRPETLRRSPWDHAVQTLKGLTTQPDFITQLQQNGVRADDVSTPEYATVLSTFTEAYLTTHGDMFEDPQTVEQMTLLSNTPSYLHMQNDLDHYESKGHLTPEEHAFVGDLKRYVVWFNQRLSGYIHSNSEQSFTSIKRPLIDFAVRLFPRQANSVEKSISETARGARTEVVTRQILDLTNSTYRLGDVDDDLHGGDFVLEKNGKAVRLDIKSSLDAIAKIRGGYDKIEEEQLTYAISKGRDGHRENDVMVLFPGFTDAVLGDKCRLSDQDAATRSHFVQKQIEKAFHEMRL